MDTIMKPKVWPKGVLVSEFRHHKGGVGGKNNQYNFLGQRKRRSHMRR